jgi:MurNAc alpha-1-phosphate uridylyltransferase
MKAMILAAGRGDRLRPLTDETPKPLLEVDGRALIAIHLERLAAAGYTDVVVNLGWLGDRIEAALGDGARWGVRIRFSREGWPALETGGGIRQALPMLGPGPFLVVNGDVWTDFDVAGLVMPDDSLTHLVMVPNPAHNPDGDFRLDDGRLQALGDHPGEPLTYSGIALFRPALFESEAPGRFPLAPLLSRAIAEGAATGVRHAGEWDDVGTPERLAALRRRLGRRRARAG